MIADHVASAAALVGVTLATEQGKTLGTRGEVKNGTDMSPTGEVRSRELLLKVGALQDAIFSSANFSIIATDESGVIQLFNVGAERTLGYAVADVVNKITPAEKRQTGDQLP